MFVNKHTAELRNSAPWRACTALSGETSHCFRLSCCDASLIVNFRIGTGLANEAVALTAFSWRDAAVAPFLWARESLHVLGGRAGTQRGSGRNVQSWDVLMGQKEEQKCVYGLQIRFIVGGWFDGSGPFDTLHVKS
jgi:hypothetical protein